MRYLNIKKCMFFICMILFSSFAVAQSDTATIIMHDTIAEPGEVILQIDALNFTGDNGQVAAITLHIDIDTNLLGLVGIANMSIPGSWLYNYNHNEDAITITYNAPFGNGYDLDGKLLDLKLTYDGGFDTDLIFKPNCEISNKNLQTIDSISYNDGHITQAPAIGSVTMDTVGAVTGLVFYMPLRIAGNGYDSITTIALNIEYDTNRLTYDGYTPYALSGITVSDTLNTLKVYWNDPGNPVNFTTPDTLLLFHFTCDGDTNTTIAFRPGSKVYNNSRVVATDFFNGYVQITYLLELISNPIEGGQTLGSGYYVPGNGATVTAIPGSGYLFDNWSVGDSVVSQDSMFVFIMPDYNITLTANFTPIDYELSLFVYPDNAGNVFGEGIYHVNDPVSVSAISGNGFEFAYWTNPDDSIVSYDTLYGFLMPPNNYSLTANFAIKVYTITAIPNDSLLGSVSGGGLYEHSDTVLLTATPAEDCIFVAWTEDGLEVSDDPVYIFIAESNRDLVGNFQLISDCPPPVALSVIDIGEFNATIHWIPSGDEPEWDVLWGYSGFDTTSQGTLISGLTETTYVLEGLEQGTLYDFYVRAVCSENLRSDWAGPETFSTLWVGFGTNITSPSFLIYPNPTYGELCLKLTNNKQQTFNLKIINSLGIVVQERTELIHEELCLQLDGFTSGFYLLLVQHENGISSEAFILH